ncbi:methyltransferase (TIGR00027 family) [Methanolinea mesophila]|nr:methyltransferase (TIGR00027 family) [Methanolinea mesophila]
MQRFVESNLPEDERICYDPYAVHFIDPDLLLWARSHPDEIKAMAAAWEKKVPGWSNVIRTRVRYFDDMITAAARDGLEQLVILGAGYDTRAYRIGELTPSTVFEVDRPAMLHVKAGIIKKIFGSLPSHVTYVPTDLSAGDLEQVLSSAGCSVKKKTLFLLEGLVMYLPVEAIGNLFGCIRQHAGPGSIVLFDYIQGFVIDGTRNREDARTILDYTRALGEPFLSGFSEGEVVTFLAELGFTGTKILSGEDCRRMYFRGKRSGQPVSDLMVFVSAEVPERPIAYDPDLHEDRNSLN